MKAWTVALGVGAAVGAVAILMMPATNTTRKLANKAACKIDDAATRLADTVSQKLDLQ